jgi:hypothetical protein
MSRDLHHNIKAVRVVSAASLGATAGGGAVGKIVDRQGYDSAEFIVNIGTVTATNATVTAVVKDGDVTGTMATATAAAVLGTLTMVGATSARASGVSKNCVKRIGYIGKKRYVSVNLVPTVSGGIIAGVEAVLGHPAHAAVAEQ